MLTVTFDLNEDGAKWRPFNLKSYILKYLQVPYCLFYSLLSTFSLRKKSKTPSLHPIYHNYLQESNNGKWAVIPKVVTDSKWWCMKWKVCDKLACPCKTALYFLVVEGTFLYDTQLLLSCSLEVSRYHKFNIKANTGFLKFTFLQQACNLWPQSSNHLLYASAIKKTFQVSFQTP